MRPGALAWILATVALACLAGSVASTQGQALAPVPYQALGVRYADGRTTYDLIRASTRAFWTSMFPRLPGPLPEGVVRADSIRLAFALVGPNAQVTVSVLRRSALPEEAAVATVVVKPGDQVAIHQLASVGIEPIVLFLSTIAPLDVTHPTVVSQPADLHATAVETMTDTGLSCQVTVDDLSPKAARAVSFEAYHGGRLALSGRRAGREGQPFVLSGGSAVIPIQSGLRALGPTGVAFWPPDRVVISSVLWDDGTSQGDARLATESRVTDDGDRLQLDRVIQTMKQAVGEATTDGPGALAHVRVALEALPIEASDAEVTGEQAGLPTPGLLSPGTLQSLLQVSFRAIRSTVVDEVKTFEDDRAAQTTTVQPHGWLAATLARYEAWRGRLRP